MEKKRSFYYHVKAKYHLKCFMYLQSLQLDYFERYSLGSSGLNEGIYFEEDFIAGMGDTKRKAV